MHTFRGPQHFLQGSGLPDTILKIAFLCNVYLDLCSSNYHITSDLIQELPPYCFPQQLHQFTFPSTVYKGSLSFTSLPTFVPRIYCTTWGIQAIFCNNHKWKVTFKNYIYIYKKRTSCVVTQINGAVQELGKGECPFKGGVSNYRLAFVSTGSTSTDLTNQGSKNI